MDEKKVRKYLRDYQFELIKLALKTVGIMYASVAVIVGLAFYLDLLGTAMPQVLGVVNGLFIMFGFVRPRFLAAHNKLHAQIQEEQLRSWKDEDKKS